MVNDTYQETCTDTDEELIDVLIAISIVSKQLAMKLRNQSENVKEKIYE